MIPDNLAKAVRRWSERDPDARTRDELQALIAAGASDELASRFSGRLEFGTAGLRGIVGAGPMRMNRLVIRETTTGLGRYLLETIDDAAKRGVFVTYDARPDSQQFARDAASILAGLGIRVFFTESPQPTPIGAFGVLNRGSAAGIVVTASHNPPAYNGYKVYWENGAQILSPHDEGIAALALEAASSPLPWQDFDAAVDKGTIEAIGAEGFADYQSQLAASALFEPPTRSKKIGVAYTPLHGAGGDAVCKLLGESGLCDLEVVASQFEPDGAFPTVEFPNPEEPGAMDAVIALAREHDAELACANDPDADRFAVAVRTPDGDYQPLTGDQVGVLLGDHLLRKPRDYDPILCTTIVSSRMLGALATDAGAKFYETLTGFKWLSNVAMQHESENSRFLFAYEEALGYAVGPLVRDKDGLSAMLAFVQLTAELAADGQSVFDRLETLYRKHGLYLSAQRSIALDKAGAGFVARLLSERPDAIGNCRVESCIDLQDGVQTFADGRTAKVDFAPSNVSVFFLDDGSRVIVRPSGTEPKIKCYYEVVETMLPDTDYGQAQLAAKSRLNELIAGHQASIDGLLAAE